MAQRLYISIKLVSLKRRFQITDDAGVVLYDCTWKLGLFSPPWVLTKDGAEVARFRRKIFAWRPTWLVSSIIGDFRLRRKLIAIRRRLIVLGGPLDGAEITGSLLGMSLNITRHGTTLAEAHEKLVSIRDRYSIDVIDESPPAQLLTAIVMANLLVEKTDEKREAKKHESAEA